MNKSILVVLLTFFSLQARSQVKGVVSDKGSKAPIPYSNIWIEHKHTGTTSDEAGRFSLIKGDSADFILFTAIGYENKRIKVGALFDTVYLQPVPILLSEVRVLASPNTRSLKIKTYNKAIINYYLGSGGFPRIIANYFPYNQAYQQTAFLKQLSILTASDSEDALFHIRLYRVSADGKPGEYLHQHSIKGIARKGKSSTRVNLEDLNLRFPEEGLFIAIEWLIIDRNKHVYKNTDKQSGSLIGEAQDHKRSSYQPMVGTISSDEDKNSWQMIKGVWHKVERNRLQNTAHSGKYILPAIELILSN
ncbi:carboxypeptidase-like regulatory domain-containing protein [Pontibacter sp. BT310]|uniref:Carboxypeptidase-like regulatory domain-containing protein n=1 Tax=Pontibacter populi TaxID=890055 RepID=A0ABS6XAS5_9BACT|nr:MULTISPECIES: carboxypeptidase-like regulatory domain-containing protein [Pontibacter]MBJ6118123.1 carboxypeptidase-like regulatory domain-containing protein [Pontibacter sp. BT310]MBR0570550.1 carboxypeptidase-like regulatory domain-containing protein [Microvirga sp. STS03]MBW3364976.1 carboxypeptidase-like regulatory domain-containing protein [Pontibacter populi]